jgi:nucleoside-diphosphate-sugar epimerase/glycosyltransferase involved in cell wall biosynthesis
MIHSTTSSPIEVTVPSLESRICLIDGPILVLGASGFVGANLLQMLLRVRSDVHGTASRLPAWRLATVPKDLVHAVDLLIDSNLDALLDSIQPKTVFNCVAFGAYSFETDAPLIYQTNFHFTVRLLERLLARSVSCYIHAGSSSEYGSNCSGPDEQSYLAPNSHYAVSKASAAQLIHYYGQHLHLRCANLRLYSVYGPFEDSSRLIPNLVRLGLKQQLPDFVRPDISRDFVYIDDVCEAFVQTAIRLRQEDYGGSFNIGTGVRTTIADVANVSRRLFNVTDEPRFTMPERNWDVSDWFASTGRAKACLKWTATTDLQTGLEKTATWMRSLRNVDEYLQSSRKFQYDSRSSVSAIIACYKDGQAIPIMYSRLKETFRKLNIDHEIIFVNDCSPDNSEEIIRELSKDDPRVVGISHSRNFGSQAAFMSGLRIATRNSCVLLDGDLQDPPELIESFVKKWREGYDVVYGRRVKREATLFMQLAYKAFYRIFDYFSYVSVPHDAGDFCLMDRRVVRSLTQFPERDLFLRGLRAFAGFRQTGVDYHRPERMFGTSTNNLVRNIGWAKKGILSFSNTPLNMLSVMGSLLLLLTFSLAVIQLMLRLLRPELVPRGITTLLLVIMFFGSLSIFCIAVLGEYLAKIFEEVKRRPLYIRRSVIRRGEVRDASDELHTDGKA